MIAIIISVVEGLIICGLILMLLIEKEEIESLNKNIGKLERSWDYWKRRYLSLKSRVK